MKTSLSHERKAEQESDQAVDTDCHCLFPSLFELRKLVEKPSDSDVDHGELRVQAESDQHHEK